MAVEFTDAVEASGGDTVETASGLNLYISVAAAKRAMGIPASNTSLDALLSEYIEAASREIDTWCKRYFYTRNATRAISPNSCHSAFVDDLISVETMTTDDPEDSEFEAVEYETTEYQLYPLNEYPKMLLSVLSTASQLFIPGRPTLTIEGIWGYGDGSASPWDASGVTGTVASTSGTALALSLADVLEAGQTIRIQSEQMFIRQISGTTATVRRAVNGTIATTHAAQAISTALYPSKIVQWCRELVCMFYNNRKMAGQSSETVDQYTRSMMGEENIWKMMNRCSSGYTRN